MAKHVIEVYTRNPCDIWLNLPQITLQKKFYAALFLVCTQFTGTENKVERGIEKHSSSICSESSKFDRKLYITKWMMWVYVYGKSLQTEMRHKKNENIAI